MSDKRRKYSSESSDDSYEREKRKKSKYHKEHRRKHKKEHRREEKRSSSHDRKKYRRDRERHRSKYDDRGKDKRDKETDHKYKSKHEKYEHDSNKKSIIAETKKTEIILPPVDAHSNAVSSVKDVTEDMPSTSTNSDVTLPTYYNSSVVNAQKFAEQQKKRKLLWQNKKTEESAKWTNLKFSQDNDGTKANKFMRLMGIKDPKEDVPQPSKSDTDSNKSDEMLKNMEHQYEVARNITHLSRGFGLGFK